VVRRVETDFAHGAWTFELSDGCDASVLPHVVSATIGLRDDARLPMIEVLLEHLRKRKLLLVLQHCERALEPCAGLVESVLERAPDVHVLATSRKPLGVPGEQVFMVGAAPRHGQRSWSPTTWATRRSPSGSPWPRGPR
jgi:predicted ATPase